MEKDENSSEDESISSENKSNSSENESNSSVVSVESSDTKKSREQLLKDTLESITHAWCCDVSSCVRDQCIEMKNYIGHYKRRECGGVNAPCEHCIRLFRFLVLHAKDCQLENCRFLESECQRIKGKISKRPKRRTAIEPVQNVSDSVDVEKENKTPNQVATTDVNKPSQTEQAIATERELQHGDSGFKIPKAVKLVRRSPNRSRNISSEDRGRCMATIFTIIRSSIDSDHPIDIVAMKARIEKMEENIFKAAKTALEYRTMALDEAKEVLNEIWSEK